jgi:calcineurin-like phosphoesterase family protein
MGKIFVTSDTHFGHDREFVWGPRGFSNYMAHDNAIVKRWNEVVGPDDTVFHLGDVMLGDNSYGMDCLAELNGNIKIIPGNHDTATRLALYRKLPRVEVLGLAEMIKYKKYNFYLSHHPTITSNLEKAPYLRMHLINLFGHTHQQNKFYMSMPYMFHVGMDSNNCTPVLLDDAIEMMKKETEICIEMLGLQEEQKNECDTCGHNPQCSASADGKRCKDYLADPLLGG